MSSAKKLFTNTRVIILVLFLILSVWAIHPALNSDGVAIRTVTKDTAATLATPSAIIGPEAGSSPMSREVIKSINNKPIKTVEDYYAFLKPIEPNRTLLIKTSEATYRLKTLPDYEVIVLNETEEVTVVEEVFDNETNTTKNVTTTTLVNKTITNFLGTQDLGLSIYQAPSNNIRKGLDLEGGTRVLLQAEEEISADDLDIIITNIRQRLNIYGVSDIIVRSVRDFTGEAYILVEIAGVNQDEVRDLLSKQGKFEAKIGEAVVFKGGDKDVTYVCRSASCSGIDPQRGCGQVSTGEEASWVCGFRFSIALSPSAAQAQADATRDLPIIFAGADMSSSEGYLSENLSLYLDDELVDQLRIGASLKGNALSDISISGSGTGPTKQAAALDTLENMKELQTVLITGSLPVKLNIIQSDAISPVLGEEFIKNALFVGILALLSVVVVISIRYRKLVIAVPTIIAMFSEVIIIMGFAALIGWRLDLAAIAGIIIAVGTGVDDQIVIVDETLSQRLRARVLTWKEKLKRAFFIIMTSYFTTVVAMLPLWFSGAGLLKGFALTTIVGVTIGVFVTRPAFASILEILLDRESKKKRNP